MQPCESAPSTAWSGWVFRFAWHANAVIPVCDLAACQNSEFMIDVLSKRILGFQFLQLKLWILKQTEFNIPNPANASFIYTTTQAHRAAN